MESRVNYTLVGLFVVILTATMVVMVFWLAGAGNGEIKYNNYVSYMEESVSGLTVGAQVKFNGVTVGDVSQIGLRPDKPDQVRLVLKIQDTVPITTKTVAILRSQGVTGLEYVDLSAAEPGAPPLVATAGEEYPVIKSEPSFLFQLRDILKKLAVNMTDVSEGLKRVLNEQNQQKITQSLQKLDAALSSTKVLMANSAKASKQFPQMASEIRKTNRTIQNLAKKLNTTAGSVKNLTNQIFPQAVTTLRKINTVASNMSALTQELKQNPSVVIRGKQIQPLGPGEK